MTNNVKSSPDSSTRLLSTEIRTKAPEVSQAVPLDSRQTRKLESAFATQRPPTLPKEAGARLSRTASPDSLWGGAPERSDARAEFLALSPEKRAEKLAAIKEQRAELKEEIGSRIDVLWKKLSGRHTSFRAEVLKSFKQNSNMAPEVKTKLEGLLASSDQVKARLDGLRDQAEGLPKTGSAENKVARSALAREILAVRKEQSTLIKTAEKLMADSGMMVDLLVDAEAKLDPNAPPDRSLCSMVTSWLGLGSLVSLYESLFDPSANRHEEEAKTSQLKQERRKDERARQQMMEELGKQLDHQIKMRS